VDVADKHKVSNQSDSDKGSSSKRSRGSQPLKESPLRHVSYHGVPTPKLIREEELCERDNILHLLFLAKLDKETWPEAHCCIYTCGSTDNWKKMENPSRLHPQE